MSTKNFISVHSKLFDNQILFLKDLFFKKSADNKKKKHARLPRMQRDEYATVYFVGIG